MGIEFELKFRATAEALSAIGQNTPEQEQVISMQTTYYDTPDGVLSAKYYTLRCRQENQNAVCTLKTPAKGQGRNEFEIDCAAIDQALPLLEQLSGEALPRNIVPVCGAKFTRIAKTICLPDCTVELALDQGILTGGNKELPLCEVEVELKSGSELGARMYAGQLALAFGLTPEKKSKFRRAKELAEF